MSFFDAVASAFKRYFDFSGRSSRSEFWWFFLFCCLLYMLAFSLSANELSPFDEAALSNPEAFLAKSLTSWFGIAFIVTLIPSISISVRRFHDINMSGWWYVALQIVPSVLGQYIFIFSFISVIALFVYLYFMCSEGGGDNQYGTNPLHNKEQL
tara:strand:- start:1062 stop:1523 length:462 start_codon:yes stop_codon:yes gene_type:complete